MSKLHLQHNPLLLNLLVCLGSPRMASLGKWRTRWIIMTKKIDSGYINSRLHNIFTSSNWAFLMSLISNDHAQIFWKNLHMSMVVVETFAARPARTPIVRNYCMRMWWFWDFSPTIFDLISETVLLMFDPKPLGSLSPLMNW